MDRLRPAALVLAIAALATLGASCQLVFHEVYLLGSNGYDLVEIPEDGYVIAGVQQNAYQTRFPLLVRVDGFGTPRWSRILGTDVGSLFRLVRLDATTLVAFFYRLTGPGYESCLLAADLESGSERWRRCFPQGTFITGLAATGGGVALVTTPLRNFDGAPATLVRLDASGNTLWSFTPPLSRDPGLFAPSPSLGLADDGSLFLAVPTLRPTPASAPLHVYRVAATGAPLWARDLGLGVDLVLETCAVATTDGGVVVGFHQSSPSFAVRALRLDASGNVLWTQDVPDLVQAFDVARLADGGFVFSGYQTHHDELALESGVLSYLDAAGTPGWSRDFRLPGDQDFVLFSAVVATADGGLAATGAWSRVDPGFISRETYTYVVKADAVGLTSPLDEPPWPAGTGTGPTHLGLPERAP